MSTINERIQLVDELIDYQPSSDYTLCADESTDPISAIKLSLDDAETEFEDDHETLGQLEELASSLEAMADILSANPNGADSATMRFAAIAVESLTQGTPLTLSTEHFNPQAERRAATQVALESIGETLKNAYKKIVEFIKRLFESFWNFLLNMFAYCLTFKRKVNFIRNRATKLKQQGAKPKRRDVKLPSSLQYAFQTDGKDYTKLITAGSEWPGISEMMGRFAEGWKRYGDLVVKETESVSKTLASEKYSFKSPSESSQIKSKAIMSYLAVANNRPIAEKAFGSRAKSEGLGDGLQVTTVEGIPGNRSLKITTSTKAEQMITTATSTEQVDEGFKEWLKTIGQFDVEVVKDRSGTPTESVETLTTDTIIAYCDRALLGLNAMDKYKAICNSLNDQRKKLLRDAGILFEAAGIPVVHNKSKFSNNDAVACIIATSKLLRNMMRVGYVWMRLSMDIIRESMLLAQLSIKQYTTLDVKEEELEIYFDRTPQLAFDS